MFLNFHTESVDNKIMKNLWKILTFLLLFTLTACMPDSLTKFKEEPTKKAEETTSSGGSGDDDSTTPTSTCVVGTDPECTSPGPISFDEYEFETVAMLDGNEVNTEPIEPFFPSQIPDQAQFISFESDDPSFQSISGLIFDPATGIITNSPSNFLPKTSFNFTATYDTPELASPETSTATLTFTTATDLKSLNFPAVVGQKLIITLDDVSLFTTTAGFNNIVTASGAYGTISYIDEPNKELHVDIATNVTGTGTIGIGDEVDNNTTFFTSRAEVTKVYYDEGVERIAEYCNRDVIACAELFCVLIGERGYITDKVNKSVVNKEVGVDETSSFIEESSLIEVLTNVYKDSEFSKQDMDKVRELVKGKRLTKKDKEDLNLILYSIYINTQMFKSDKDEIKKAKKDQVKEFVESL